MLIKIAACVVVLGLCGHGCLAQTRPPSSALIPPPRPATLDLRAWQSYVVNSVAHPTLFPEWSTPVQTNSLLDMDWKLAKLASKLSDIHPGMPFRLAVQRLRILGGREDGGLQSIPPTRYYFSSGVIVNVPQKDGRVTGSPQLAPGSFAYD